MKNKAKLAFDLLEQEMEVICKEEQVRFTGGSGGWTWQEVVDAINTGHYTQIPAGMYSQETLFGENLREVMIGARTKMPSEVWGSVVMGGTGSFWLNMIGSGGYVGGGGGGGGGGGDGSSSGSSTPSNYEIASNIASNAISTGLAFNEFYANMSTAIFSSTPVTANDLLKNIFDNNPAGSFMDDLRAVQQFKGIAILSLTGKLLGYSQAYDSLGTLKDDILDGGGVSAVNVADAAISVGSLFIKSNVVGLAVSGGWLLIKGQLDDQ